MTITFTDKGPITMAGSLLLDFDDPADELEHVRLVIPVVTRSRALGEEVFADIVEAWERHAPIASLLANVSWPEVSFRMDEDFELCWEPF